MNRIASLSRLKRHRSIPSGLSAFMTLAAILSLWTVGCSTSAYDAKSPTSKAKTASSAIQGSSGPTGQAEPVKIPYGTVLTIRLLQTISSETAKSGDSFDAEVAEPVMSNENMLIPKSARVRGRVMSARESGRIQDPGFLKLTLDSIQTGANKWLEVETNAISREGKSHTRRNTTMIGGGAGLGALLGGLAGGGKGAAIGAGIGAGAGTAGAAATGKKDVKFSAESLLSFKTARALTIPF